MTVVSEQAEVVGVRSTVTVLIRERGDVGCATKMSSSLITPSEPSESGCSGSDMVEIRSYISCSSISSRTSSSESDEIDAAESLKYGSTAPGCAGISESKIPARLVVGVALRRVGRSEGLMIVGFAFYMHALKIS